MESILDPIHFIIVCLVVGLVLWLITKYVPMEPTVRKILVFGVCAILVIWLISGLLGMTHVGSVRLD